MRDFPHDCGTVDTYGSWKVLFIGNISSKDEESGIETEIQNKWTRVGEIGRNTVRKKDASEIEERSSPNRELGLL